MNFQNILFVTAISLTASLVQAGDKRHAMHGPTVIAGRAKRLGSVSARGDAGPSE
ncbi:MAG: hypothetical protein ACI9BO_000719 [Zhongshania sp.]|jgi:hypothetical protein